MARGGARVAVRVAVRVAEKGTAPRQVEVARGRAATKAAARSMIKTAAAARRAQVAAMSRALASKRVRTAGTARRPAGQGTAPAAATAAAPSLWCAARLPWCECWQGGRLDVALLAWVQLSNCAAQKIHACSACRTCISLMVKQECEMLANRRHPFHPWHSHHTFMQVEKACLPALRELGFDEDHIIVF